MRTEPDGRRGGPSERALDANERMIQTQIVARGVRDPRVIEAFRATPRDWFVPPELGSSAWDDSPLPIGGGQTISQPYIVAYMTEALGLRPEDRVLEIGTGSAYQTAILARLAKHVHSAEIVPELARRAAATLERIGVTNVTLRTGDALEVFRDEAPFDAILAAAAPGLIPQELVEQLAGGGRAILPVGTWEQSLVRLEKHGHRVVQDELIGVRFVPLIRP
ncbi:MAG TPA: protein-L-isoaspartate(D-aspartate) O-methyltransferase [Thermoanaerobaculia bacterium]|nr:protein-L-isoaspartate(D-aspartate) O-methyltransferase [Thermoanaerobaculia bacterium]